MIDHPPVIYDHPFAGQVVVIDNYGGELTAWDGPCYPWLGSQACAKRVKFTCYVFAEKGKLTKALLHHEIAHCNGWPADHPQ